MLKNNKLKLFWIAIIVVLLALIRYFETNLFYDPFLAYYKLSNANSGFPKIDILNFLASISFRFWMNSGLSILLLWLVFKDKSILKFSIILYLFFFVVLLFSFFIVYFNFEENGKMALFYIRRFLIQPILLLLFLPGFYYQRKVL